MSNDTQCCGFCAGIEGELHNGIKACRNPSCKCHTQKESWQHEFDRLFIPMHVEYDEGAGHYRFPSTAIKEFVARTLAAEREALVEEIASKMEKTLPNKTGDWDSGHYNFHFGKMKEAIKIVRSHLHTSSDSNTN